MATLPIIEAPAPRLRVLSTPVTMSADGRRLPLADVVEQMDDAPESGWPINRS